MFNKSVITTLARRDDYYNNNLNAKVMSEVLFHGFSEFLQTKCRLRH